MTSLGGESWLNRFRYRDRSCVDRYVRTSNGDTSYWAPSEYWKLFPVPSYRGEFYFSMARRLKIRRYEIYKK